MKKVNIKNKLPCKGDQFFKLGQIQTLIGKPLGILSDTDSWGIYAMGYEFAVDVLVNRIRRSRRSRAEQNFYLYPIAFCARHNLELVLKQIYLIVADAEHRTVDLKEEVRGHKLTPFWNKLLPAIRKAWPNGPEEQLQAVTDCLEQFEKHDASSFSFRYPQSLDGKPSTPSLPSFDLSNFYRTFKKISGLLSGISDGLVATSSCTYKKMI